MVEIPREEHLDIKDEREQEQNKPDSVVLDFPEKLAERNEELRQKLAEALKDLGSLELNDELKAQKDQWLKDFVGTKDIKDPKEKLIVLEGLLAKADKLRGDKAKIELGKEKGIEALKEEVRLKTSINQLYKRMKDLSPTENLKEEMKDWKEQVLSFDRKEDVSLRLEKLNSLLELGNILYQKINISSVSEDKVMPEPRVDDAAKEQAQEKEEKEQLKLKAEVYGLVNIAKKINDLPPSEEKNNLIFQVKGLSNKIALAQRQGIKNYDFGFYKDQLNNSLSNSIKSGRGFKGLLKKIFKRDSGVVDNKIDIDSIYQLIPQGGFARVKVEADSDLDQGEISKTESVKPQRAGVFNKAKKIFGSDVREKPNFDVEDLQRRMSGQPKTHYLDKEKAISPEQKMVIFAQRLDNSNNPNSKKLLARLLELKREYRSKLNSGGNRLDHRDWALSHLDRLEKRLIALEREEALENRKIS